MSDPITLHLAIAIVAGLTATVIILALLARGLGLRVHRSAVLVSLMPAGTLVVAFVLSDAILVPTSVVTRAVPDAPSPTAPDSHRMLNDVVFQFVPWEAEDRRAMAAGRLPLWSDRLDGGSSPWLNPQAGVLSPIAMLARLAPLQHHLLAALAFKLVIAFQGAWILARLLGARRSIALLAGLGFALGGGIMAWSLFPHSATAAWMPWLAAASIRVTRRPGTRTVAVTGVITACLLLSGHPETAVGGGLLAATCATCFSRRSRGCPGALRGIAASGLAAALGFALAAPHLVPFARHLPHTVRYHRMSEEAAASHDARADLFSWRKARFLRGVLNPEAYGGFPYASERYVPLAGGGYAGVVALAGTFISLGLCFRRCRALVALGLLIGLMVAGFRPAVTFAGHLPLVRAIEWTRLVTVIPVVLSVCGAVGLSELARRRRPWMVAGAPLAAAASLAFAPRPTVIVLWAAALVAFAVTLRRPGVGFAGLAAVCVLDLGPWSWSMLPKGDSALFFPETPLMAELTEVVEADNGCRVVATGLSLYPSLAAVYGIADLRYHNPVADAAYARVLGAGLGFHSEERPYEYMSPVRKLPTLLDFLNTCLVVTARPELPPRFHPIRTGSGRSWRVYANPGALPRAFLPTGVVEVAPEDELEATVSSSDPTAVVVARSDLEPFDLKGPIRPAGSVTSTSDTLGRVKLHVRATDKALVATSLTHPRGWRATADGRKLRTITVNHAFLGVVVPTGIDSVELRFVPPGLAVGFAIGLIGLVFVVGLLSLGRFR